MRNGNNDFVVRSLSSTMVLTVPMRNGNSSPGWGKLTVDAPVLTVPMRNGNDAPEATKTLATSTFLPYLWGMETCFSNCDWYGEYGVLTVPMRNGNFVSKKKWCEVLIVLTVPMRNGNYDDFWNGWWQKLWFLPYLWGMETICESIDCTVWVSSYRTYEEWKLFTFGTAFANNTVLTVPMRNGNIDTPFIVHATNISSYRTYEEWKPDMKYYNGTQIVSFLPYLWGMET